MILTSLILRLVFYFNNPTKRQKHHINYQEFIADIMGYPRTYVVDKEGNIVGSEITGSDLILVFAVQQFQLSTPNSLKILLYYGKLLV